MGQQAAGAGPYLLDSQPLASSEISGSVALDGGAAQPLLAPGGPGLRHFRVPQHLHWPDALGGGALAVYLTPDAQQDLRQACVEFLAALPRCGPEGVACLTAALPPMLRLAELPPAQLGEELDALLHSGRTLMLQVRLWWLGWGTGGRAARIGAAGCVQRRLAACVHAQLGSAPLCLSGGSSSSPCPCLLCPPLLPARPCLSCTTRCPRAWPAGRRGCATRCC